MNTTRQSGRYVTRERFLDGDCNSACSALPSGAGIERLAHETASADLDGAPYRAPERTLRAAAAPLDRRTLLKLLAATSALPLTACGAPSEPIVPYVNMPEGLVAGEPRLYATAFELDGIATGVLAESHEGRPTKIEGNPDHPASLGSTDAFQQAELLSLYDPGRASLVRHDGAISSYEAFQSELVGWQARWGENGGADLRILIAPDGSPTRRRLLEALKAQMPKLHVHSWAPIGRDNERAGARLAFGRSAETYLRLENAVAIVALDADLLGPGPEQARLARGFAAVRTVRSRDGSQALKMAHLLSVGPQLTATAAMADERLAVRRGRVDALARTLAARLGIAGVAESDLSDAESRFVSHAAEVLRSAGAAGLVTAGEGQPLHVHGLCHRINQALGGLGEDVSATVSMIPVEDTLMGAEDLAALADDMRAGRVRDLLILDANPVYDAPADLEFVEALRAVENTIRLALYEDETSEACRWHLPRLHSLETWSDVTAKDGLAAIVQPLVTPLYEGHSPLAVLAAFGGAFNATDYSAVRATWAERANGMATGPGRSQVGQGATPTHEAPQIPTTEEAGSGLGAAEATGFGIADFWTTVLAKGFVDDPAIASQTMPSATAFDLPPLQPGQTAADDFEIVFSPDPSVWDGRFSNNAWLQETPRPITSEVWGNAAAMNPADQRMLGLGDGGFVSINAGDRHIVVATIAVPGQAAGTLGLTLGYGRRFGSIARGVGTDVYPLRSAGQLWAISGAKVETTGAGIELALTQSSHAMEERDIARSVPIDDLSRKPPGAPAFNGAPPTLYPEYPQGPYEWAMVIDQNLCISCNACVVACQAENNVPVVGPEEIRRGRDMHWLRIDSYLSGDETAPRMISQPVPCMHCEKAPCEPMCPVGAAIHDSEGLNVQVYNRCVGTRDCQSNCPYKVRRFNFFGYANGQEFADLGEPMMHAVHNPDVTVRARGVMEKCMYCVQRISGARREAEKENRTIAEGEVVTACQQACPTRAITFGNLSEKGSAVNALRREPHHYALLEELGTRPRTTYLAKVENAPLSKSGETKS